MGGILNRWSIGEEMGGMSICEVWRSEEFGFGIEFWMGVGDWLEEGLVVGWGQVEERWALLLNLVLR